MRLLLSLGMNGYGNMYRQNIDSHRRYAERIGCDYWLMDSPLYTPLEAESAWLKLPAIWAALRSGYDWVCYVDSDVLIQDGAPDFATLEAPGKSLYMAEGFSGRLNGGVIIVKNGFGAGAWFENLLEHIHAAIPAEDDVGWGENGHIIHFARGFAGLSVIPPTWNNNRDPGMADYFRHFSAGVMRPTYRRTLFEKLSAVRRNLLIKATRCLYRTTNRLDVDRLVSLYDSVSRRNAKIARIDLGATLHRRDDRPILLERAEAC